MSQELSLTFTENIYYSTKEPVSIKDVITSLQGWEAIAKQSEGVLQELTGANILDISVHVARLEAGSLYEDIVIKLLFGSQEEMDKFLAGAHAKIGNGKMRNALVGAVVIGLVGYGLVLATKEGANKRGNSSRLTQSFHFFMFEPIFSPVNALNQPI